ncbi:hypothetical protein ABH931_002385 [Streptacidiphilus sp. MAP12-33]|uniref:hypothetical protein n=1 Tax=Streptacidiphilus sp. MAP12-33 TaxID=3156266 RepID=UPI003513482F
MQSRTDKRSGRGESARAGVARGAAAAGGLRPDRPACEVVTVPERQGLETVDILRLRGGCGAVLLEETALREEQAESTLSFLVPFGTAAQWQLPGSSCRPMPARGTEPHWLLPPAVGVGSPALTDPGELRAALGEAARTLAASEVPGSRP